MDHFHDECDDKNLTPGLSKIFFKHTFSWRLIRDEPAIHLLRTSSRVFPSHV